MDEKHYIHFRYTYKNNPWQKLSSENDGQFSVNVSLAYKIGMAFKDEGSYNIPALKLSTFISEAKLSEDTSSLFLVTSNKDSDSLNLSEFSNTFDIVKLNDFQASSAVDEGILYYYDASYGMTYLSKGSELIFGNYYSTTLPADITEDSLQHYNWNDYVEYIYNEAYLDTDRNISAVPFSHNVAFSNNANIIRRYTNPFGVYEERDIDTAGFGNYIYLSSNETTNTLVLSSKNRIYNGLYISTDEIPSNNINTYGAGVGCLKVSKISDDDNFFVFGNVDFTGNYNSLSILGLMTGSKEVKLIDNQTHKDIKVFNSNASVSTDIEDNDISKGFVELRTKGDGDIENFNTIHIKSISTDRSIYSDNIYNVNKQYIAGFNDITGKCICMSLSTTSPEVETIDMPLYANAQSMNVVGFFGKFCVTDSLQQFATIVSGKSVPSINWAPKYDYTIAGTSYSTMDEALAHKKDDNSVVYINNNVSPVKYCLLDTTDDNQTINRHCCFDLALDGNAKHTSDIGWSTEMPYEKENWIKYSDFPIKIDMTNNKGDLPLLSYRKNESGNDIYELIVIAFIKFDSQEVSSLSTSDSDWHWHFCHYKSDIDSYTHEDSNYTVVYGSSQNSVYYPINTTKYAYAYSYTNKTKTTLTSYKRDHWYAIIVSNKIDSTSSPYTDLLDICYDNTDIVHEDFVNYLQNVSIVQRKCKKQNDNYIFEINVQYDNQQLITCSFSIPEGDGDKQLGKYFTKEYNADGSIKEIILTYKDKLIEDFGDICRYFPTSELCINVDKETTIKKIYSDSYPICIPEFSGCTFVSYK